MERMVDELILRQDGLEGAVAALLAYAMGDELVPRAQLEAALKRALPLDAELPAKLRADLDAVMQRDPAIAAEGPLQCLLHYKGFKALQAHRVAHALWNSGGAASDRPVALWLQSRASQVWGVDIHPAARVEGGLMLDHGTGVVIGETAALGARVLAVWGWHTRCC